MSDLVEFYKSLPALARNVIAGLVIAALPIAGALYLRQHLLSDATRVPTIMLTQYQEAAKHIAETPEVVKVFDDVRGREEVRYYSSDGCSAISLTRSGLNVTWFVQDLSRLQLPKFAQAHATLEPAAWAQGRCYPAPQQHPPPPPTWMATTMQQCLVRIDYQWADGCHGHVFQNPCTGAWSAFYWDSCVH